MIIHKLFTKYDKHLTNCKLIYNTGVKHKLFMIIHKLFTNFHDDRVVHAMADFFSIFFHDNNNRNTPVHTHEKSPNRQLL